MLDKVLLVFGEFWPIPLVAAEVDFIDSPEACHLVLVHFPNIFVLDWQDDEAVWVFFEQRLRQSSLSVLTLAGRGHILGREKLSFDPTKSTVVAF